MGKRDSGNKQARVSAASLVRRAKAHMEFALGYRKIARTLPKGAQARVNLDNAAQAHEENAQILRDEAKYVRELR